MRHDSLYVALLLGSAALTASVVHAQEPAAKPDPVAAAARVNKALQNDRSLPAGDITVSTHANTVLVSGEVDSEEQKSTVTHVAEKAAEGVRISNNVEVRPQQDRPVKDQLAAQQAVVVVRDVNAALQADARTSALGITASSEDGRTVVLQGLVPNREDRRVVQSVAGKVKGVTRIDNRVTVPGN
jgi:osmotically-inducible protein OsmY